VVVPGYPTTRSAGSSFVATFAGPGRKKG
jgi:hypothetical protein